MLFSSVLRMNFSEMNLSPDILQALADMKIVSPTEVQEQAIPKMLASTTHVMAQAKTGTGKTLAFSIPIVEKIDVNLHQVQAVVLVPTRELCKQVHTVISDLTKNHKVSTVEVYGGVSIDRQINEIRHGAQVVVATPGRLIDIYQRREINFKNVKFVVLDEADRMLDMGFMPDIEFLLLNAMSSIEPRLCLFSATLFESIKELVKRFTKGQDILEIDISHDELTVENCKQYYYLIDDFKDKYYHFVRILRKEKPKHSIIFVNTKRTGEWLPNRLQNERGLDLRLDLIQGDLTQRVRETVLKKFKEQQINGLIATDVAARGLDIPEVTHVFNYDIPEFEENYVHRIGRTSRMQTCGESAQGVAISLVVQDEFNLLCRIEGFMNKNITKLPLPPRNKDDFAPPNGRERREHSMGRNPKKSSSRSPGGRPPSSPRKGSYPPRKRSGSSDKGSKGKDYKPDPRQFLY